jgi:hypothetical protein
LRAKIVLLPHRVKSFVIDEIIFPDSYAVGANRHPPHRKLSVFSFIKQAIVSIIWNLFALLFYRQQQLFSCSRLECALAAHLISLSFLCIFPLDKKIQLFYLAVRSIRRKNHKIVLNLTPFFPIQYLIDKTFTGWVLFRGDRT